VSKRLNTESRKQRHTIAQGLQFSDAKDVRETRPVFPYGGGGTKYDLFLHSYAAVGKILTDTLRHAVAELLVCKCMRPAMPLARWGLNVKVENQGQGRGKS